MKHRRRTRRSVAGSVSVAAIIAAVLVIGHALDRVLPDSDDAARPFERAGVVGEPLDLRYGTIEIGAPVGSTRLDSGSRTFSTTGVYVVVPITFTAAHEPQTLSYAAVRDAEGRIFEAGSQRSPYSMNGATQPGIPRHAYVAVELPADAVAGAQLVLAPQPNDDNHRRDDVAVFDLGLTEADAQGWSADENGVAVETVAEGSGARP
ncbi:hypothetical protein [Phytoactinopolyspora mesophila]|uniref:DUF4352 domain-containing protein n=1 Tax=Phytoactinopolyspora mesophila TaxID=2650750 RepID=A0A7K3M811_9ACTN|nr:hypothetical protein [Phytoactinopolyspora mesophila]NDL59461.1 hypothetical protein [Phytoactinopolyspora mesophila]